MKIAILNSFYFPDEPGGAERSVRTLAESLVRAGNSVVVFCLGDRSETTVVNGVTVERLEIRNGFLYKPGTDETNGKLSKLLWHVRDTYNAAAAADVEKLLRKHRPDVFHTNNVSGFSVAVWRAAKRCGIPVVHTTRDFYLLCPKTTMMHGANTCEKQCTSCAAFSLPRKAASNGIAHVVGISRYILNRHQQLGCFVGVPASVIHNSFDAATHGDREFGEIAVLGYIGRLAPTKGVELLIDAFRSLNPVQAKLELHIAGDGAKSYVEQLKTRAADLPIKFLGHRAPETFFPNVDFTVVPSIWNEPLGRVVIESMAYGKGVVATPMGGIPELVHESAGIVCKSTEPQDLSNAIEEMLIRIRDNRIQVALNAKSRAAHYSSETICVEYSNVYRSSVGGMRI